MIKVCSVSGSALFLALLYRRIHSIFLLWQLEGKGSCDVDIDQSASSLVM